MASLLGKSIRTTLRKAKYPLWGGRASFERAGPEIHLLGLGSLGFVKTP